MTTQTEMLRNKAVDLLKESPNGLRYSELVNALHNLYPNIPYKSLPATIWDLDTTHDKEVFKPSRGLFKYRFEGEMIVEKVDETVSTVSVREEEFYEPFANWLRDELGECSEAVSFGGSYFNRKWGTPDVIGIYKPSTRDIVKFQPEIVSAEIKINPSEPITAFGQAISYRLFSSKVYLVEPRIITPEDQDRIEALCILFGIGFIMFDVDLEKPNFQIRVRAQRYNPDMFYVNEFADRLFSVKKEVFKKLFG